MEKIQYQILKKYQERLKKINIAQSSQEVKLQHKGTVLRKYIYITVENYCDTITTLKH